MTSVTFPTNIGGDGSTVSDDDNATTGLRNGGWRTRFIPCFTNQVAIATTLTNRLLTLSDTSSSSVAIGLGAKSFTTAKFYNYAVGQFVVVSSTASPTNYMYGQVTAYNSTTGALSVTVTIIAGSGTIASWTISVSSVAKVTTGTALLKGDGSGGFSSATSGTDYVIPSGTVALSTNCTNAIGYSQSWQNLTASRALGTSYTNSSGKPILVIASVQMNGPSDVLTTVSTGTGVNVGYSYSAGAVTVPVSFIVPNGQMYMVALTAGTGSLILWSELR